MVTRTRLLIVIAAAVWATLVPGAWADQLADAGNAARAGDYPKAVSIYRSLAAKGDPKAQNSLGTMYYRGVGVEKNVLEAIRWLSAAAKGGDIHAETTLGAIYYSGDGVPADFRQAYQFASTAAAANDPGGQYLLGLMYATGKGTATDYKRAYVWFSIAAEKGLDLAARNRDIAAQRLDSTGLNEAKRLVNECKNSDFRHCG
jgi:TPR repeat protein